MKKKKIIALLMGLAIVGTLTACGGGGSTPSTNPGTTNPPATQPSDNPSTGSGSTNDETIELASYKSAAISKLDEIVNPVIEKIPDEDLKTAIKNVLVAVEANDKEAAVKAFDKANKLLDKAVADHIKHKNYAARQKSRLAKAVNAL